MNQRHPWLCAGAVALSLAFQQQQLSAEEPPREEQVEVEVTESVQQVAEKAAEAAKAIAAEAAAEAQQAAAEAKEAAAKIAADAAEHAEQAAQEVIKEVTKAAGEVARQKGITGVFSPAPYQLGLQVAPVSKALDAQLKLEGKGILIDVVEKDGPGDQAGLKPHDIVVSVAEHDLTTPADLVKILTDADGTEMKFDVIRGGEKLTVTVQPRWASKVSDSLNINLPKVDFDEEIIQLESKIREKLKGAGVDVRMQVIRPGQVMPADFLLKQPAELPEDVSISVRKESGKPAKIEVSRGEEKWEVTEESLDKLPEELRPHVEHMLGRGPVGIGFPPNVKFTAPLPPGFVIAKKAPVAERHAAAKAKVERAATEYQLEVITRSLDEIHKDIRRLYDQIDELREDRKKD